VATRAALGIVAVGGHMKRVVPHPPCEHPDRLGDLPRSEIAYLDKAELGHGGQD
jgi:hypothetical protein